MSSLQHIVARRLGYPGCRTKPIRPPGARFHTHHPARGRASTLMDHACGGAVNSSPIFYSGKRPIGRPDQPLDASCNTMTSMTQQEAAQASLGAATGGSQPAVVQTTYSRCAEPQTKSGESWIDRLLCLLFRFPEYGVSAADICAMSMPDAWGVYLFFCSVAQGA